MITIRHHWLLPGSKPGDVVGATVMQGDGVFKVQEWVLTPDKMVLQRWLIPSWMPAE